jgi:hypothetical protein
MFLEHAWNQGLDEVHGVDVLQLGGERGTLMAVVPVVLASSAEKKRAPNGGCVFR